MSVLAMGWLLGCSSPSTVSRPTAPAERADVESGVYVRQSAAGRYSVQLRLEPAQPALGDLFRVVVNLRDAHGRVIETATVTADAQMPEHGHGMMTRPVPLPGKCDGGPCVHAAGAYVVEGFRFHMPGAWTVTVSVDGPEGADTASFVVEAGG